MIASSVKFLFKWLLILVLILLLCVAAALGVVAAFPTTVVPAVAGWAGVDLQASKLDLKLWPVHLAFEDLVVVAADTRIEADRGELQADLMRMQQDLPFYAIDVGHLAVTAQPASEGQAAQTPAQEGGSPQQGGINVPATALNFQRIDVESITLDNLKLGVKAARENGRLQLQVIDQTGGELPNVQIEALAELGEVIGLSQLNSSVQLSSAELDLRIAGGGLTLYPTQSAIQFEALEGTISLGEGPEVAVYPFNTTGRMAYDQLVQLVLSLTTATALDAEPIVVSLEGSFDPSSTAFDLKQFDFAGLQQKFMGNLQGSVTPVKVAGLIQAEYLTVPLSGSGESEGEESEGEESESEEAAVPTPASSLTEAPNQEETDAPAAAEETAAEPLSGDSATPSQKLFADSPIPLDWLQTGEIDVDVRAEVVNVGAAAFEQASADINLASDVLLAPFSMRLGDGGLDGEIGLAATPEQTLALKLDYTLQGLSLEQFGLLPTEELRGGKLSSKLSINSQGRSPAELAAALSGSGHFMMRDAMLQNDLIEIAGSDLILEMLSKLNPFQKKDPTTQLQCGLVRFNAQEGQVSLKNGLAVETRKMVIAGKGKIDLANETLDLTFTPSARQGVGINVGSLVKFVKLGGTLLNPSPVLDAAGALQSGLAIGAALSTGGVSVLAEGLAKRVVNSGSACDRLGKPESTSTAAEEQQQTPVEQQEEQPEEQPEEQQEQPDDTPTG